LKPSNIRLSSNQTPCLFDFSLNDRENGLQMTENGRIVGTAAYLAPEQLPGRRRELEPQTDVYALGAILYELLTGRKPFPGEGQELLRQIAKGSPVPPRAIDPDIPKPLETICLKCLETNPKNRYQLALDVTKELRLFLEDKPIQTQGPGLVTQFSRWCKRRWILAGMLLTFLLIAALGACYVGWQLWQSGGGT
jgi:serine/threonine-protein kinase